MAVDVLNGTIQHSFWDFKGQEDYVDSWFLMGTPYTMLFILISYLVFVLRIGPEYMKGRSPINLQNVLLVYNAAQVAMSMFLFVIILSGCYWYFIAKVSELLDTVFFVLRKKSSQVSFLHVYHHTFTAAMSWTLIKYWKVDDLIFVGTLNSFVHIWMYGYYWLAAFPGLKQFLWWKKYLTTMQMIQFVMALTQCVANAFTSKCPPSLTIIGLCLFHGLFFIYLFSMFYNKTYNKDMKQNQKSYKKDDDEIVKGLDEATANFLKNSQSKWKR